MAAVAAVDRHVAEEALALIAVDYEVLPFVLDMNEALTARRRRRSGRKATSRRTTATKRSRSARGAATSPRRSTTSARVFEDRYTTAFVHNAQMEPRACLAHWEGDKLTVYTPTGGIANCRHDMARDLGIPDDKVRVVVEYMGGNFGNKNQNQDADLITAMLAKEAGAPVKLELSRKEDFIGVHGRWPTTQHYTVGTAADGTLTAIQLRGVSGMGPYRKNSGTMAGIELYKCAEHRPRRSVPAYTNRTVSANFRGPGVPAGVLRHPVDDGRRRATSCRSTRSSSR